MSKKPETWEKRGIVKQILKDHFHGFWQLHADLFPEELQKDIETTVQKAIRCGTQDMERNIRMIGQRSNRNES